MQILDCLLSPIVNAPLDQCHLRISGPCSIKKNHSSGSVCPGPRSGPGVPRAQTAGIQDQELRGSSSAFDSQDSVVDIEVQHEYATQLVHSTCSN